MIERHEVTRTVCPAELKRTLPPLAEAEGAVIRHNDAGGRVLDAIDVRRIAAEGVITDAKTACVKAGAQ